MTITIGIILKIEINMFLQLIIIKVVDMKVEVRSSSIMVILSITNIDVYFNNDGDRRIGNAV